MFNAAPLAHPVPPTILALAHECDVVVVNEEEAATLAQADAASPRRLVVTLGARGARWSDDGVTGSFPAYKVQAVDTVGAGDTFVAAVAVALADGADLEEAVRRGCAAGALATQAPGAQASMPSRAQLIDLLEEESHAGR